MTFRNLTRRLLAPFLAGMATAASAQGFLVLSSTDAALRPGDMVEALSLARGEQAVLLGAAGEKLVVTGPHEGAPGSGTGAADSPDALQARALLMKSRPLATRGARSEAALDLVAGGDWCAATGDGGPALAMPPRGDDRVLRLEPSAGPEIEAIWPAGAPTIPWPGESAPQPGDRFRAVVGDVPVGGFAIVAAPASGTAATLESALALDAAGCASQAAAVMARFIETPN
jgi:hypothetical protein